MALVVWVRLLPLSLAGVDEATRAEMTYRAADGREYVYLGDYDSYAWLRSAANLLRTGTTCDAVVGGRCRDTYTDAPAGRVDIYRGTPHVAAIAALHRLLTTWWPQRPLAATAFLIPVLLGALGVLPAFALARRLGGNIGGWCAAVLIGLNPLFLGRSLGADNDVWNVVLPLYLIWAAWAGLGARRPAGQIAGAVAAAACAALNAAVWRGWRFAYGVVLAALLVQMLSAALRQARQTRDLRVWRAPAVRSAALVAAVFYVATGILVAASGRDPLYLRLPVALFEGIGDHLRGRVPHAESSGSALVEWPNALEMVAEYRPPTLAGIAQLIGGQVFCFAGWLGVLLLLLPRRAWRAWHFAVLLGGTALYRYLLAAGDLSPALLLAWLAVPLVAAWSMRVAADEAADDAIAGIALAIWLMAGLYFSHVAVRMVLLLVVPLGLAVGVMLGRLYERLREYAAAVLPGAPRLAATLPLALIAALVAVPIQRGVAQAQRYLPAMSDAWWETLATLRTQSPADAIVTTSWDYGYWVKYVAERRTSADGGSLLTRIPLWTAQALMAPNESESVGLLRMLACGSDPRGAATGACGALLAFGLDVPAAYEAVRQIARLDGAAVPAYLGDLGLPADAHARVLAASHCVPPPTYLILSTQMIDRDGWRPFGSWRPGQSVAQAMASAGAWRNRAWLPCDPDDGAGRMRCPIDGVVDGAGTRLEAVSVDVRQPAASRLRVRPGPSATTAAAAYEAEPALLVLARADRLEEVEFFSPLQTDLAVLADVPGRRVLLGPPALLRSTFVHLVYLDGRYARHFEKLGDRSSPTGERVLTYRIEWDRPR